MRGESLRKRRINARAAEAAGTYISVMCHDVENRRYAKSRLDEYMCYQERSSKILQPIVQNSFRLVVDVRLEGCWWARRDLRAAHLSHSQDEVGQNGAEESDTDQYRSPYLVKMTRISSPNQSNPVLI